MIVMSNSIDLSYLPQNYESIKVVWSWRDLLSASFNRSVNCIVYPRRLSGDFTKLAQIGWDAFDRYPQLLKSKRNVDKNRFVDHSCVFSHFLWNLYGSPKDGGWPKDVLQALEHLKDDERVLSGGGFKNSLRVIKEYDRYEKDAAYAGDFHADRMGWGFGRIGIRYTDPATEFICNGDGFLQDDGYTIHAKENAEVFRLHAGDVCRMATKFSPDTEPFIHRGPVEVGVGLACISHHKLSEPYEWTRKSGVIPDEWLETMSWSTLS